MEEWRSKWNISSFQKRKDCACENSFEVERNDAKSPEGKFLALREDGEDFVHGKTLLILQVNSKYATNPKPINF